MSNQHVAINRRRWALVRIEAFERDKYTGAGPAGALAGLRPTMSRRCARGRTPTAWRVS